MGYFVFRGQTIRLCSKVGRFNKLKCDGECKPKSCFAANSVICPFPKVSSDVGKPCCRNRRFQQYRHEVPQRRGMGLRGA